MQLASITNLEWGTQSGTARLSPTTGLPVI
jgi:hypothetical protein